LKFSFFYLSPQIAVQLEDQFIKNQEFETMQNNLNYHTNSNSNHNNHVQFKEPVNTSLAKKILDEQLYMQKQYLNGSSSLNLNQTNSPSKTFKNQKQSPLRQVSNNNYSQHELSARFLEKNIL
jgi:hypothetical protein